MKLHVGTSGYNYDAWRGTFYPDGLPAKKMLGFYAQAFGAVEINYSFYRKPTPKILAGWAAQVPEGFRFALKCWNRITHQKRLRDCDDLVQAFTSAATTLGSRLGPVLVQLPPTLKPDLPLLQDFLARWPREVPAAFEFRHEGWFVDSTWEALRAAGASLCVAEDEDLATPDVRTADLAYYRLRRLDYDETALRAWAGKVQRSGARDAFVFFKHEDTGTGPKFASSFLRLTSAR